MADDADRFDCILGPDELWTVWDNHTNLPANMVGLDLISLTHGEAHAMRLTLNRQTDAGAL